MAPIRVGIIGVAGKSSAQYTPGEWGVHHLRAVLANTQYELIAICNSTVESARRSIDFHQLDANKVRAYGSVADLAADPQVDLVVVAVDASKHVQLAQPVIEAGKDVYVEFPLAPTVKECEHLAQLAKDMGVRSIAGTQAHSDPAIAKLRYLVQNEIGNVVSTVLVGTSPIDSSAGWPASAATFLSVDGYASRIRIVNGHILGGFSSVVGEFEDLQVVYKTQSPVTTLLDDTFQPIKTNYPVTSPDHVGIQGVLRSGALASINIRVSAAPVDDCGFRWIISGTAGEAELVTKPGFFQTGLDGAVIKLRKRGEEASREVDWHTGDLDAVVGVNGWTKSISRVYAAFAEGREGDYATLETALGVHRTLDNATAGALWASK
ncbi:uncharacterized protein F5Z01DRAFT_738820 [Emericellopsis atlantica]|uniref:Gfo/Idh/MocA-like oxidoreductase N-terminal domain-containing protein n=1 Tax=Emericellopsis atlantica TaxID=2614577 RepID=A0A9P7ZHS1_9HYPO|nr:uncharacterized protein F5Z01DRAFT_738820 [Emericellopsis atlantica]KAG9251961.1 hypothetical protein F5Z01DRAFT_738820 [Emericellopsis atlantica]